MISQTNPVVLEDVDSAWLRRYSKILLFVILMLACALRFVNLTATPPGLNQDEAANAWSAYCLLKTGKDYYYRTSWPLYYVRNVGGNSSTLYVYLMMPFQAIGGLNVYTTRLPAAVGGTFAVWLIYFVGRRMFGSATALAAAALLAVDPWHLQHSRNGLESSITSLTSLAPLALLLWAGLLSSDNNKTPSQKPVIAALAGLLTGIGCYGHWEVRLFVPTFLFLIVLFTLPSWWKTIKTRKGALAVALFSLGFAVTWGALIWQHIFHPEGIGRHALFLQKGGIGSVPVSAALKSIAVRYIQHFGLNFLFIERDPNPFFSPPGIGRFYWYMAPLMLAGLIWLLWRFKSSYSARVIIAFVLAYPVGDCLVWGGGLSILRSAPGVCALVLLSAVGAVDTARWLWTKNRNAAIVAAVIFSVAVIGMNLKYLHYFYVKYSREPAIYEYFHTDLVEACEWLKPRFDDFDAIYVTTDRLNMPYVVTAVALNYDPKKWFSEPIEIAPEPPAGVELPCEWDFYTRYGKMHFIYDYVTFSFMELQKKFAPGRILFILRPDEYAFLLECEKLERPDEFKLENPDEKIIHKIYAPDGSESLVLCRF
jgi:4-amino-4-deoxy-L-arabinose transferase-like glycosyltransferase